LALHLAFNENNWKVSKQRQTNLIVFPYKGKGLDVLKFRWSKTEPETSKSSLRVGSFVRKVGQKFIKNGCSLWVRRETTAPQAELKDPLPDQGKEERDV